MDVEHKNRALFLHAVRWGITQLYRSVFSQDIEQDTVLQDNKKIWVQGQTSDQNAIWVYLFYKAWDIWVKVQEQEMTSASW